MSGPEETTVFSPQQLKETEEISVNFRTPKKSDYKTLTYNPSLDEFISGRPAVHECGTNYLRLKLTLKNGKSIHKRFRSVGGKKDLSAYLTILSFLQSNEVVNWVRVESTSSRKSKKNPKTGSNKQRRKGHSNLLNIPEDMKCCFSRNPELYFEAKFCRLRLKVFIGISTISKTFKCSKEGKEDKDAIAAVNNFLQSEEFKGMIPKRKVFASIENIDVCTSFEELIHGSPRFVFCRPHHLIVQCTLKTGVRVFKRFPCSSKGKDDDEAISAIVSYLESNEGVEWLKGKYKCRQRHKMKEKHRVDKEDNDQDDGVASEMWIPHGEVETGEECKRFFENFKFNYRKNTVLSKNVKPVYLPTTLRESVTENEKWGRAHRLDEKYELKSEVSEMDQDESDSNIVYPAVVMNVCCSSQSPECRTQCGVLLSSFEINSDLSSCPGCQVSVTTTNKVCAVCGDYSSPKWYDYSDQTLCNACYLYKRKHGKARPSAIKYKGTGKGRRLYHPHFKCGWRMRFIIYSDDLGSWKIFRHKDNEKYHVFDPVQPVRRPSLVERDTWDYHRVALKASPRQVFSSRKVSEHVHSIKSSDTGLYAYNQIRQRVRTVDKHAELSTPLREEEDLSQPIDDLELQHVIEVIPMADDAEEQVKDIFIIEEPFELDDSCENEAKTVIHNTSEMIRSIDKPIVCCKCIAQNFCPPYMCSSQNELMKHISVVHNINLLTCSGCWVESGTIVPFPSEYCLKKHVIEAHSSSHEFPNIVIKNEH